MSAASQRPANSYESPQVVGGSAEDTAKFRAKLAGKRFAIYQEDLDGAANRMQLVDELRVAIEKRDLALHYQPQVDLGTGEIGSVEALVRWTHPRLGFIPPLEFIGLAEDAGLMGALTAFVLDEALAQCAAWRAAGRELTVSVNISASDLLDPGFPALVERLLTRHALTPEALVLEMTETTAIANFERSQLAIQKLHDLGLVVSVDDFGAGFTSLAYLGSLAVGEHSCARRSSSPMRSGSGSSPRASRTTTASVCSPGSDAISCRGM